MPTYTLKCRRCDTRFDVVRTMAQIDDPAPCPTCRDAAATVRLLPTVAVTGVRTQGSPRAAAPSGCCGGGCGCG